MLLKGKTKPAEVPAAAATPAPAAAPAKTGGIKFGTKAAAPTAPVVETPTPTPAETAAAEAATETTTEAVNEEAQEVDVDKMSSAEIDKMIKEAGYEADMPEGFAKMKVAEKRAIIKKMFGGEGEAEATTEAAAETVAAEVPAAPAAATAAPATAPKGGKTTPAKAKAGVVADLTGKDAIADFAHHVENLKEKDALELAAILNDQTELTYFRLGGVLAVIQSNGWYAPYASFREYIEQVHGLQYRTALYYVGIYNALVENKIAWDSVKDVGWTKLKEIADVITPENVDQWVELAKSQTVLQLIDSVKAAKKAAASQGETTAQVQEGAAVTVTTKTFKVHEDQKKNIELAIEKAKKDSGTAVDTVALDFICLDFLAGNAKASGKAQGLPSLAEQIKAAGVEEAFAAIEAAFPNVVVNVELPEDGNLG
jgi:hypothetical protein